MKRPGIPSPHLKPKKNKPKLPNVAFVWVLISSDDTHKDILWLKEDPNV